MRGRERGCCCQLNISTEAGSFCFIIPNFKSLCALFRGLGSVPTFQMTPTKFVVAVEANIFNLGLVFQHLVGARDALVPILRILSFLRCCDELCYLFDFFVKWIAILVFGIKLQAISDGSQRLFSLSQLVIEIGQCEVTGRIVSSGKKEIN